MASKNSHVKNKPVKPPKAPKVPKEQPAGSSKDMLLLARLVLATIVFAVALVLDIPDVLSIVLLAVSVVVAGYDIVLDAVNAVEKKDFFATPLIVILVTVLSFVIGFGMEGAALVMLYQIGLWLISYAVERSKRTALDLLRYQDRDTVDKVKELVDREDAGNMDIASVMKQSSSLILKIAMVIAIIYAVVLPLASSYTYTVSIHRALTIIVIATPMSMIAAMPMTGIMGMCYSASEGVIFNNARTMEKADMTNIAVFDKAGVFAENTPRLLSVDSDVLDADTFMNFAAHAVYYSEQPFARAISAQNEQEYRLEVLSNFVDLPGKGVELIINGAKVCFGTEALFIERGVQIPVDYNAPGQAFYMTVSGRYVGKVCVSSEIDASTANIANELNAQGIKRVILVTEEGSAETQRVAEELDIKECYGECSVEKKLGLIKNIKEGSRNRILYVYSNGIESHSAADIDIRVSNKAKYADATVVPGNVNNIPFALQVCRRMKEVAITNAVFVFIVKAILIFLSIVGFCNVWFAIFIDMVAAIASVLNTVKVTQNSVLANLKYKMGK